MQFDLDTRTVTISSWAYESTPGQAITVGPINDVPAPIGIAGLAAGAAWTRKLRRRSKQSERGGEA